MSFPFFVARRYLVSKKSTNAINLIAIISVVSVTTGTAALVIVLSALNGMTDIVKSLYNSFDPDIKILPAQGKTFIPGDPFSKVENIPGVKYYCEALQENALVRHDDKQHVCVVKGVGKSFRALTGLDSAVIAGRYNLDHDTIVPCLLGGGVAARLDVAITQYGIPPMIQFYVPRRDKRAVTGEEDAFYIGLCYPTGVFSLNDDFDFKYMLIPLEDARKILGYGKEVSSVEIGLDAGADADAVKEKIQTLLGGNFTVKTRFEQNEVLFKTLRSEKWWTLLIMAFIMVVGTFNVIGCVTMLIIEKKKDLYILSAMGCSLGKIRRIFLLEGMLIVFSGAAIGLGIGLLACWLQQTFHLIPFSEGFIIDYYPVDIRSGDLLVILSVVGITGVVAGWLPVLRLKTAQFT
ncbi:MAG: FtsX-like permease family protein [Bacteroidia bacterium]|nr:FtsX-like permease family protein [Bacteroidia bacterium]